MKGDFTRPTFKRIKHYSSVRKQQGRVPLDADWNEEIDILNYLDETTRLDVIGPHGVPKGRGGFEIQPNAAGTDLTISDGRIYVDGILAENESAVDFAHQEDWPNAQAITDPGTYLIYVDVWQRHITALEDDTIRETALGGPDTATRTKTTWQVKSHSLGDENAKVTCKTLPNWQQEVVPVRGKLSARAEPQGNAPNDCIVEPGAGYRRLENQLYRVEIHNGTDPKDPNKRATFKWSRDNGSVVVQWISKNGDDLKVSSLGRDKMLGFAPGNWVELTDDTHELLGQPGTLVQVLNAEGQVITIKPATATGSLAIADFPKNPKVRRWDMGNDGQINVTGGAWIDLEDGVQVEFDMSGIYQTGDYWLIPARTIPPHIEWSPAGPQSPHGVDHHLCGLAIVKKYPGKQFAAEDIEDCRDPFPALTTICAEDVCYDDSTCDLGAETVQQAIDQLCRERDLRYHNKHLHGWGIVCGLEVVCGDDPEGQKRSHVTVKPGYAIDCDGNDITLNQSTIDVIKAATDQKLIELDKPAEISIILKKDGTYDFEKYDPKQDSDIRSLLAGTMLLDFYNDCLKNIQDFLQKELTPPKGEENLPAGPVQQRVAALTNLLAQAINPQSGQNIFISPREDKLLRESYEGLRAILQSETFCAMFDNARPFPEYPFADLGMDTIYAKSNHTRLRLRPGGQEAFTAGAGLNPLKPSTKIYRFDLKNRMLLNEIDPLTQAEGKQAIGDTAAGPVEDVAFSLDGNKIHVIMPTKDKQNTLFRTGTFSKSGIQWGPLYTICGVHLVTLATTSKDAEAVYAIGLGQGLYRIIPDNVDANPKPMAAFNAVGHLKIADDGRAFATAAAAGASHTLYNTLKQINLPDAGTIKDIQLDESGSDDIAIFTKAEGAKTEMVYCVLGPSAGSKRVDALDMSTGKPVQSIPIENTMVRLATYAPTRMLLYTSDDGYCLRLINMDTNERVSNYLLPLQVGPIAIAADPQNKFAYVLNQISDTISVVPGTLLVPSYQFPFKALADYRKAVLEAFADLLAGFLQYLKDCLCDHFLVKCPECLPEDKIYLACVSVRNGEVYKVCNFSKRRYVKSFPTIEYWLSLIPIMPLIDRAIQDFCCLVLPDIFGKFQVAAYDQAKMGQPLQTHLSAATIRKTVMTMQDANILQKIPEVWKKVGVVGNLYTDRINRPDPPPPEMMEMTIINEPVATTAAKLEEKDILVKQAAYDPGKVAAPLSLFRTPSPGSEVTLYEKDGLVRYYTVDNAPTPQVGPLRDQIQVLQAKLEAQQAELVGTQRVLNEREAKISALDAQMAELKSSLMREARRPKIKPQEWMVHGQVLDQEGTPVNGARVRMFDRDHKLDDLLGEVETDEFGDYAVVYHQRDFVEISEGLPELYVMVSDAEGNELYSSSDSFRFKAGHQDRMDVNLGERTEKAPAAKRRTRRARK